MNAPNKLYEELLKEHPELKNSQEDIQGIIISLQKLNPNIQIDENFKLNLKNRLDSIATYNPSKSPGYFSFLKYFVPVFTFGFAIFGFVYFSQDFKEANQQEIGGSNSISENNIQENNIIITGTDEGNVTESIMIQPEPASLRIDNNMNDAETGIDKTKDDISDEILNEITPMLFSMPIPESSDNGLGENGANEMVEEIFQDLSDNISEDSGLMGIEPSSMRMMIFEEEIDEFKNICLDSDGLMQEISEGERICVLEKISCLESDYKKEKCLIEK